MNADMNEWVQPPTDDATPDAVITGVPTRVDEEDDEQEIIAPPQENPPEVEDVDFQQDQDE